MIVFQTADNSDNGPVEVNQKMAVFGTEILGLNPEIFQCLNPSKSLLQSLGLSSTQ